MCMSCWDAFVLLLCITVINLSQNEHWKIDVLRLFATKFLLEVITVLLVICCFCLSDSLAVGEGLFVEQLVCRLELECCTPATVFPRSTVLSHTVWLADTNTCLSHTVCLADTNTCLSHTVWLADTNTCLSHSVCLADINTCLSHTVCLTSTPVCLTLSVWLTPTPVCHTLSV